jgi:hypothetical protein
MLNMITPEDREFIQRAERLYEDRLKAKLETSHNGDYLVIEPESGDYFLGHTLREAKVLARVAHPGRMTHVMRVGYAAAYHIGGVR